jgi:CO/xanthine dehydrogenase Mo-binding subunit
MPQISFASSPTAAKADPIDFRLAHTTGEAPNALAPAAIVPAFFDATGVQPRGIPLTPGYVTGLLRNELRASR